MYLHEETGADDSLSNVHRYFPEWADRPSGPDMQHESDRNSYLAGGYADEFGYGAHPGGLPAIAPLAGDPENSRLWREQIGALHPGYPECPKPVDRHLIKAQREAHVTRQSRREPQPQLRFRVIPVRPRNEPLRGHMALRLGFFSFLAERLIRRRHLNDVL